MPGLPEETFRTFMVVAAVGTVFAAGYLLWMLQKVAFGTPKPEFADAPIHDVNAYEWASWTPILLLILVLGIFPGLLFEITNGAVTQLTTALAAGG
jgi:NADH-quinone oxidoreductase subunit M